jgi:uncharacterized protein YprB with RNaseH-like and TPR domain
MNIIQRIRCIHRHTIEEHPACFAEGNIKYEDEKAFTKATGKAWYQYPDYRIGTLDIETDGLKTDFSTLLSWAIKEKDGEVVHSEITKKELFSGDCDKRLVKDAIAELSKYKIIIGYYDTGFDLPFLRTKALHYDLDFPHYGTLYNFDLYYTVKSKLCLSRKSLDAATDYLNIPGKTRIDREIWRRAKYGDPEALKEVSSHNISDVEITEALFEKLYNFRKWIKTSV